MRTRQTKNYCLQKVLRMWTIRRFMIMTIKKMITPINREPIDLNHALPSIQPRTATACRIRVRVSMAVRDKITTSTGLRSVWLIMKLMKMTRCGSGYLPGYNSCKQDGCTIGSRRYLLCNHGWEPVHKVSRSKCIAHGHFIPSLSIDQGKMARLASVHI
jgi:hypothetical protein